jgi:hypothetical protein
MRREPVECPYCHSTMAVTQTVPPLPQALVWRCNECMRACVVWQHSEGLRSSAVTWKDEARA